MDDKVVDRPLPAGNDETLRKQAVEDLRKRHDFAGHILAYLTVNTFLVVIWYLTGAGFFWPAFPMFGWGIGIVFHAWDVFWPQPSETAVRAAMDRIAHRQ